MILTVGIVAVVGIAVQADGTESSTATNEYSSPVTPPANDRVLWIGDSYSGGSNEGGRGDEGVARLVTFDVNDQTEGRPVNIVNGTAGGSGYTNRGPSGQNFVDIARSSVEPDDRLVVIFGSRNDAGQDIDAASADLFSHVRTTAPRARLLVIGPAWTSERVPPAIFKLRDTLAANAAKSSATFYDPLAEGWFFGADSRLIGADGVQPTDAGHRYMADLITPLVQAELAESDLGR